MPEINMNDDGNAEPNEESMAQHNDDMIQRVELDAQGLELTDENDTETNDDQNPEPKDNSANESTDESNQSIAGLPPKFKSVQDLAKSYQELEKKFHADRQKVTQKPNETPTPDTNNNNTDNTPTADKSILSDILQELNDYGRLSDVVYESAENQGMSRQEVDLVANGIQASLTQEKDSIYKLTGDKAGYGDMVKWAADNVDAADIDVFNKMTGSGDIGIVKSAVQGLYARYQLASGSASTEEPNLTEPQLSTNTESSDKFSDDSELVKAMSDPRYETSKSYRAKVIAKLGRSELDFG